MVTLLIWLDGCIVEPLPELAARYVTAARGGPLAPPERRSIDAIVAAFRQGTISPRAFERELDALGSPKAPGEDRRTGILSWCAPLPGAAEMLKALSRSFDLRFAGDYPADWIGALRDHPSLAAYLLPERLVCLPGQRRGSAERSLIEGLVAAMGLPAETVIVVDPDARRASANIRAGIQSIYYNSPQRLLRELALRGLVSA